MSDRHFQAGDRFAIPGPVFDIEYRVVNGNKSSDDLRLDWRFVSKWQRVILDHAAVIVDEIHENENFLYPHGKGGAKVLTFVQDAARYGHQSARNQLYIERQRKHEGES